MQQSPVRWLTDAQYAAAPLSERFVAVADSQVGVAEVPRGSNTGPKVKSYLATCGLNRGPWCSAFVKWCAVNALKTPSDMFDGVNGLASSWLKAGREKGWTTDAPARGRVFAFSDENGFNGHCGICLSGAVLGVFRTIEGNSNDDGSREGWKVVKRLRTLRSVRKRARNGFIAVF